MYKQDELIVQCGRAITNQEIEHIQETVRLFPQLSRKELSETICEHLKWFTASGTNKIDACLNLLEKLEAQGHFRLPSKKPKSKITKKTTGTSTVLTARTEPRPDITTTLSDLGTVTTEVVSSKKSIVLWKEYVSRYHYLGNTRPFGCFLRYLIKCEDEVLGCALFAGAAKAIKPRDQWIGWTENQRLKNLAWVINNARFLIFPWVHVKNLASHILGHLERRICQDWYERWGYEPALMETFVDNDYYQGTCYKATNWKYLGMTTGEGIVRKGKSYQTTPKKIFIKPLTEKCKDILCSEELIGRMEIE